MTVGQFLQTDYTAQTGTAYPLAIDADWAVAARLMQLSLLGAALIGLAAGLATMMGDLWESMLKRSLNIKDSGGILPGHGGLLDRFDGLLLSVPIVYAYLYFITIS